MLIGKDLEHSISNLAKVRPIFHSEADLQFALAQQIGKDCKNLKIRLEKPLRTSDVQIYTDMFIDDALNSQIIELKYKTAKCDIEIEDEVFELKQQGANDTGSYDFLKDIERIERSGYSGYALMISNDPTYWDAERQYPSMYQHFRLTDDTERTGELDWIRDDYIGQDERLIRTIGKFRNKPIVLKNEYKLRWHNFSEIENQVFRYLLVEISNV